MSFFGKNIKKIRGLKKMSQQAFADLFDLKRATLGAYEEGRSEPKIDTIIKVANYFSISIDEILTKEITINQLLSFNEGYTTDVNHLVGKGLIDVPFVNEINMSSFVSSFETFEDCEFLPKIKLPVLDAVGLLAYTIQDLLMTNKEEGLYPGDIVVGRRSPISDLNSGDVVIALVNEKVHVRRLYKSQGVIELMADHINISSIVVEVNDAAYFWKVETVCLHRYPNFNSEIEARIDAIDAKLNKLRK